MQSSARNAFFSRVASVRQGPLLTEVSMTAQHGLELVSVITTESYEGMGLAEGLAVTALVKPPEILIGKDSRKLLTSARNNFPGRVTGVRGDGVAVEVLGELSGGTPMCALITAKSVENLSIAVNDQVWFFFKAFNVILSVD